MPSLNIGVVASSISSGLIYFSRGNYSNEMYKWAFPSGTMTTTNSVVNPMHSHGGMCHRSVAGYINRGSGSSSGSAATGDTTLYKFSLPTDTVTTTTALPAVSAGNCGFEVGVSHGFLTRGAATSTVYRIGFVSDTVSTSSSLVGASAFNNRFVDTINAKAYISQGGTTSSAGSPTAVVHKWDFASDTVTTTTSAPTSMVLHAGFSNNGVSGYMTRGEVTPTATVYKWAMPSDTVSTTTSLPATANRNSASEDTNVRAYISRSNNTATFYEWSLATDTPSTSVTTFPNSVNRHTNFRT